MADSLLGIGMALLTLIAAFNLFLTLRLTRIVTTSESLRAPIALPAGAVLPDFTGRTLDGKRKLHADALHGNAAVLVFLDPGCGDCKIRVGELTQMMPAIRQAGVTLWVIGPRPGKRLARFLEGTPLREHVVLVDAAARRVLNPRNSAPFYIFIDHQRNVLASHFIGDDDWLSFVEQMREIEAGAVATGAD